MFVTYENLFLFVTMLTGVIALVISAKRKNNRPSAKVGGYFNVMT